MAKHVDYLEILNNGPLQSDLVGELQYDMFFNNGNDV